MVDCERLRRLVQASGFKKKHLAHALGICPRTLRQKLRGQSEFTLCEAQQLSLLLGLPADEQLRCFWLLQPADVDPPSPTDTRGGPA